MGVPTIPRPMAQQVRDFSDSLLNFNAFWTNSVRDQNVNYNLQMQYQDPARERRASGASGASNGSDKNQIGEFFT